jgi:carbonic anhydrase
MATYSELHTLRGSDSIAPLRQKISVAIAIKANVIAKSTTPTALMVEWSRQALHDPEQYQELVLNYILAEYNTQTTATITGATDAQVQAAVNAAVDTLLGV